jgi:hypothetical protein
LGWQAGAGSPGASLVGYYVFPDVFGFLPGWGD